METDHPRLLPREGAPHEEWCATTDTPPDAANDRDRRQLLRLADDGCPLFDDDE
jgi:hypothetical protein